MVQVYVNSEEVSNFLDYSDVVINTGVGKINQRCNSGLYHIDNGDVRLAGLNKSGVWDTLFADCDLDDSIDVQMTRDGVTFFEGRVVNSSIEFDRKGKLVKFNVFSHSKSMWENLDVPVARADKWGGDSLTQVLTHGLRVYKPLEIIPKLLDYHAGIDEGNVTVDTTAIQTVNLPGYGAIPFYLGVGLGFFPALIGQLYSPAGEGSQVINLNPNGLWEGLHPADSVKLFTLNGAVEENIQHCGMDSFLYTSGVPLQPLSIQLSEPLVRNYGAAVTQVETIPASRIPVKSLLRAMEFGLSAVLEFTRDAATFTSIYTKVNGTPVNLDLLNPGGPHSEIPVPLDYRHYGYGWRNSVPRPDWRLTDSGTAVYNSGTGKFEDTARDWEDDSLIGRYAVVRDDSNLEIVYMGIISDNDADSFTVSGYVLPTVSGVIYEIFDPEEARLADIAFVGSDWSERDLYKNSATVAFSKIEETDNVFEPARVRQDLDVSPYDPVAAQIVLLRGYYAHTGQLLPVRSLEVDLHGDLGPMVPVTYGGVKYILVNLDGQMREGRCRVRMLKHWDQG